MKRSPLIVIALVIVALAAGIALWIWVSGILGGADDGISFKGNVVTIPVSENPTTGYLWSFAIDGDALVALDDTYKMDANPRGYDGVGGTHLFRFEGVGEGVSTIHMILSRDWEQVDPFQELTVEVVTGPGGTIISAQMLD